MGRYTHAHTHREMQQELHVSSLLIIIIFLLVILNLMHGKKMNPTKGLHFFYEMSSVTRLSSPFCSSFDTNEKYIKLN